jgi:hypothetical protein
VSFVEAGSLRMLGMHFGTSLLLGDFLRMQTSNQYRDFAEECERLAEKAETEKEHRRVLKEMAETWRQLANEADERASKKSI